MKNNLKKLCLIIPCYNEEKRISLEKFSSFIKVNSNAHICFVNDGSTDNSLAILNDFVSTNPNCVVLDLKQNQGKANAIRQGVLYLTQQKKDFDLLGFWDADLATPLTEVSPFLDIFSHNPHIQCVTGSRVRRQGSNINRKWSRHYTGRIFATFASLALKLAFYDTQCGAKIFTKNLAFAIFKDKFLSRWLFDIELIFRIKKTSYYQNNPNIIYELPLNCWNDISDSKLKFKDYFKAPFELLWIYLKYKDLK